MSRVFDGGDSESSGSRAVSDTVLCFINERRREWMMSPSNKALCVQVARFGMAGGLSACIYSVVYLVSAKGFTRHWAALAVLPAFLAATICGFFLHSLWSFKGHGSRDASGRQHFRYVIVQGVGLVLNFAFTWLVTNILNAPASAALLPCVILTPMATFVLQRQWVFK